MARGCAPDFLKRKSVDCHNFFGLNSPPPRLAFLPQTQIRRIIMFPLFKRAMLPLVLVLPSALFASDYTYQQTTQITGGSLLKMMKTVGVFSSQARHMGDPIVSTIYLKGNRMADVSPQQIQIIDLDQETITQIDVEKKTYSVMTFA